MRSRPLAAVMIAALLMPAGPGCTAKSEKVPQKTARITLNGNTHTSHAVSCTQVQSILTLVINAAPATIHVVLKLDAEKPKPESVNIDNLDGFTGVADAGVGDAEADFTGNNTYTITGTAQGSNPGDPSTPLRATFRIEAGC